jgi:hypothetical protein
MAKTESNFLWGHQITARIVLPQSSSSSSSDASAGPTFVLHTAVSSQADLKNVRYAATKLEQTISTWPLAEWRSDGSGQTCMVLANAWSAASNLFPFLAVFSLFSTTARKEKEGECGWGEDPSKRAKDAKMAMDGKPRT